MNRIKLECIHADTCSSDYWSGHHLAHIQIPVWHGMTLKEIKDELHSEINQGAIAGNDERTYDDSGDIGDQWYKAAHAAINRIKPARKGQRRFFTDLEPISDDDMEDLNSEHSIYAYFVFTELD